MITKVHINGYKKFKNFSFIPNERINILVGANDSGKSTLLEAIKLCIEKNLAQQECRTLPIHTGSMQRESKNSLMS